MGTFCVLSLNCIFISVERKWFSKLCGEKLCIIYKCYMAEGTDEVGAVKLLRSDI